MQRTCTRVLAFVAALLLTQSLAAQVQWPTKAWPASEPGDVGLDARKLEAFSAELAAGKHGYVDSLLVIRKGKLAFDRSYANDYDRIYAPHAVKTSPLNPHDPSGQYNYFNPWWHPYYRRGDLHTLQSVTKTITSVVIGVATARKEFPALGTPVLSFFDPAGVEALDDRKRRMTIRHLLTMTAGLDWHENLPYLDPKNTTTAMEASFDWIEFTIDRPMSEEPGTRFNYNSGATQLLSYIFRKVTGKDIEEYADRHLFKPLGIERYYWKRTPTGLPDTEGGLYLRPHDLAKIAYLFLRNGVWDGKVIVEPEWVKASVAPAVTASGAGVKYGLKWWLYPYGTSGAVAWGGSGFGGQRPLILPEHDLIIVVTGWGILPGGTSLSVRTLIDRIVGAMVDPAATKPAN